MAQKTRFRAKYAFLGLEKSRIIFNRLFLPPNADFGPQNGFGNFQPKIAKGKFSHEQRS